MARARIDKYDPISGGFRAPLAAAITDTAQVGVPLGVSLDANGRVVIGTAGNSGFVGVLVVTRLMAVGEIVDIMTDGEIVDVGLAAGTKYYTAASGALGTTNTNPLVGWTVEADRLVVRATR